MPHYEWTDHKPRTHDDYYIADLRLDGRSLGFVRMATVQVAYWTVLGSQGQETDLVTAKRMVERMLREQGHDITAQNTETIHR